MSLLNVHTARNNGRHMIISFGRWSWLDTNCNESSVLIVLNPFKVRFPNQKLCECSGPQRNVCAARRGKEVPFNMCAVYWTVINQCLSGLDLFLPQPQGMQMSRWASAGWASILLSVTFYSHSEILYVANLSGNRSDAKVWKISCSPLKTSRRDQGKWKSSIDRQGMFCL